MTTSASGRKITSACNGVTTVFSVPELTTPDALQIYLLDAAGDLNADGDLVDPGDYVLAGDYRAGTAQITFAIAPENGKFLRRFRQTPRAQGADYVPNDGFPAETHELQLDRLSHIVEELDDDLDSGGLERAVLVPDGEASIVLPEIADRASLYFKFDEDGNPVAADPSEDVSTPTLTVNLEVLDPGEAGYLTTTGTVWPELVFNIGLPRGTPGLPGALSNGTYGIIVVTDDGATLNLAANSVALAKLVQAASAGFVAATAAGDYVHRTNAQVKATLAINLVDNTADADKPVSTAQAAAIAAGRLLPVTSDADNIAVGGGDTEESYRYTGAGGHSATIADTLAVGAIVTIYNMGTGDLAIAAGAGVTITNLVAGDTAAFSIPPKSVCTIHKLAAGVVVASPSQIA